LTTSADAEVSIEVTGEGELIALGTADPCAEGPCGQGCCRVFEGRALAIVRSGEKGGGIVITASSPGMLSAETRVATRGGAAKVDNRNGLL